ncbi:DUF4214 domain-containing protein [Mesorhizobium sp. CAU 1741]|uniref:DUF4214 domain-containing protein n=1 Tax=Mesorhizobium sp. CAU 1741 TaxID=3140366 RepID=UPI00325AEDDC
MAGGAGGGNPADAGAGGVSQPLGPGAAGKDAVEIQSSLTGGGGGGAGQAGGAGGRGQSGFTASGGNGGSGGSHGGVGAGLPNSDFLGTNGGDGSEPVRFGNGGGGGAGGYGYVETNGGDLEAALDITGGNGGRGGDGLSGFSGGYGGDGGVGLYLIGTRSSLTISGNVSGGNGGQHGGPYNQEGNGASGGTGIYGQDLTITIDGGTVAGGQSPGTNAHASAITFAGGVNHLALKNNWQLDGALEVQAGSLTLGQDEDISLGNSITGSGSVIKEGTGTLTLTGVNSFTGGLTLSEGMLAVDGSVTSSIVALAGTQLNGEGSTGAVSIESGATLAAGNSVGVLSTGDLHLHAGSTLQVEIAGTASDQYDQIDVEGTVTLAGELDLSFLDSFAPAIGHSFIIIDNDDGDGVSGSFVGLAEDSIVRFDGQDFQITYQGGDGNDVSLTAIGEAPTAIALDSVTVDPTSAGPYGTVGTFTTSDPDAGDTHSYSLVSGGADNSLFSVVGDELRLNDFATVSEGDYDIRIRTTDADGLTFEEDFTISVDVHPTITSVEGPAEGSYQTGDTLSFTVNFSEHVQLTGDFQPVVFLAIGEAYKFVPLVSPTETFFTQSTFEYVVQAGDQDLDGIQLGFEQSYGSYVDEAGNKLNSMVDDHFPLDFDPTDITVNDKANYAPTALTLDSQTVAHSEGANATVGTFTTTDSDADDSHSYSLVDGGADNALFAINGEALTINDPASLTQGEYDIRVRTTDAAGLTFENDFTISVDDNIQPAITFVDGPAAGNYVTGDVLRFTVNFSENVRYTGESTPFFNVFLDGKTVETELLPQADGYESEFVFEYQIQAADVDLDGLDGTNFQVRPFEDAAGNPNRYGWFQSNYDLGSITVNVPTGGSPNPNPNPNPNPGPDPDTDPDLGAGPPIFIPGSVVAVGATANADGSPVTVIGNPDTVDEVQIDGSVVLGEDLENAYLMGEGDYSVEGNELDNVIYGNSGNTTIIASGGNDTVDGGWGDNVVRFGGPSSDYEMAIVDGVAEVTTVATGDVTRIANVAELEFADGSVPLFATSQVVIAGLYETFLGRELDPDGFAFWMGISADGNDVFSIAESFFNSAEFNERIAETTPAEFVDYLYDGFLDRQAGTGESDYWVERLEDGASHTEIALNFVLADEVGMQLDALFQRSDWIETA